jgi:hypothetical protein
MTATSDLDRDAAAGELLQSLMGVQGWLTETRGWTPTTAGPACSA